MSYGWEGNRRPVVALAMRRRLKSNYLPTGLITWHRRWAAPGLYATQGAWSALPFIAFYLRYFVSYRVSLLEQQFNAVGL